jgi:hypothetical protein
MAPLQGIEDIVPDTFSLVNQESGGAALLVMDALDKAGDIAGAAEHKAAGRGTHLASHCQPAKNLMPWNRVRLAKNWLVTWSQVADMYMRRALGKLYNVQSAATGKRTEVLPL